jgi:peptidoglycan/LPS O-acetylase OafA/YrhL
MEILVKPGRQQGRRSGSLLAFDVLRIAAMSAVAVQHVTSVSGIECRPLLGYLNPGQLGVTIFCGLSGFFALRWPGDTPARWLGRRLGKIYPPYWVVLGAVLAANEWVGYKRAPLGLLLSEFAGTGYFTHGEQMVGVHFWFVSLILLCYGIGFVLRCEPRLLPVAVAVPAAVLPHEPWFACHVLSFASGALLARAARPALTACALITLFCLATPAFHPYFAYPVAGTAAVMVGSLSPRKSPRALAQAAEATYEFFLVHGPVYLALARLAHLNVAANLALGTACSAVAAWVLRLLLARGATLLARAKGGLPGRAAGPQPRALHPLPPPEGRRFDPPPSGEAVRVAGESPGEDRR